MPTNLGFQAQRPTPDLIRLARAGAKTIKLIDDFGPAAEILAVNPTCLLVGRVFTNWNPVAAYEAGQSPAAALHDFLFTNLAGDQFQKIASHPLIKVWEGPNEPVFPNAAGIAWYAQFEGLRARVMAEHGRKAVIGNFSTGTPHLHWWADFLPALRALKTYPGYLGLHEYSCPTMTWMTGVEADGVLRGWTTLRYRKVYQLLGDQADTPLLITELGVDPGAKPYPSPWQGASDLGAFRDDTLRRIWAAGLAPLGPLENHYSFPASPDPDRFYGEQLAWYDRETLKDPYVKGLCVFLVGSAGWSRFDLAGQGVVGWLESYIVNASVGPAPVPVPTGTHQVVNATALNVRQFPWTGSLVPPSLGLLPGGAYVTVKAVLKLDGQQYGWGLLHQDGNRWVSMKYLQAVATTVASSSTVTVGAVDAKARVRKVEPAKAKGG